MDRSLTYRLLLILAVILIAAVAAYPPEDKINLGLDLQGGMHLVLQVETDDALRAEADNSLDTLEQELEDLEITGYRVERTGDAKFELTGIPRDRDNEIESQITQRFLPGWAQRRLGDRLEFELSQAETRNVRQLAVNQARETIRNRVDAFGVAEPIIHEEGADRIVVQLPGVDDPERVKRLIKNTAFLEFRLVRDQTGAYASRQDAVAANGGTDADRYEIFEQDLRDENKNIVGQRYWILENRRAITGRDLKTARPSSGEFNEPVVNFILTGEGARKFGDVTANAIGRGLAIVLDGKVVSAPRIESRITDQGVIRGGFSVQEVQDLVTVLRSGALPAGLTTLEERSVGPTLGRDSIEKGKKAGIFGGLIVVLTMIVVYQRAGINAVVALGLNVILVFGALALFGATLTLPGIAGIVLTVGMAVDANVLIFERIREELRSGRTVRSAIVAGFNKALSSILDANVTTMIAAIFLFMFGTGPIRGFAVTLSVGILASLFTAIIISRWLFDFFTSRRRRVEKLSI